MEQVGTLVKAEINTDRPLAGTRLRIPGRGKPGWIWQHSSGDSLPYALARESRREAVDDMVTRHEPAGAAQ